MDMSPVHQVWLNTTLQGTTKGGRRQGRQRERWEDNIREWTGQEFAKSQRAEENREKWRKLVVKSFVVPQRPPWLRDRWRWRWKWQEEDDFRFWTESNWVFVYSLSLFLWSLMEQRIKSMQKLQWYTDCIWEDVFWSCMSCQRHVDTKQVLCSGWT